MRTIKFRGKASHNGEWLYGGLINIHGEYHILGEDDMMEDGHHVRQNSDRPTLVEPDTIGQFTSLYDKNGKEIYEGDIVRVYDFSSVYASEYKGVVKMVHGTWIVEYDRPFGTSRPKLFFDDFADRKTEVIGNIYDNSDLMN